MVVYFLNFESQLKYFLHLPGYLEQQNNGGALTISPQTQDLKHQIAIKYKSKKDQTMKNIHN